MNKAIKFGVLSLLALSLVTSALAFGQNHAARDAMEAGDYGAWKEAKISELTEKRFNEVRGRHQEMQQRHAEIKEAMDQGYDAWKEAVGDCPMSEQITEDNFDLFVEMHSLIEEGDLEAAQGLAEELGIPAMHHGMHRQEKGFFKGR
ncbi:MAG: hypothetical protein KJ601_06315 [Nanoarchaeota archaeon]|nr:hypothetical protein [Nanoarchaeota archaeon]MBU1704384.1 hypothetical protein [Nanoarchaeota archaeon]